MWKIETTINREDCAVLSLVQQDLVLCGLLTADLNPVPTGLLHRLLAGSVATTDWTSEIGLALLVEAIDRQFSEVTEPRRLMGGSLAVVVASPVSVRVRVLGDTRVALIDNQAAINCTHPHILSTERNPEYRPQGVPIDDLGTMLTRWVGSHRASDAYQWQLPSHGKIVMICSETYGSTSKYEWNQGASPTGARVQVSMGQ